MQHAQYFCVVSSISIFLSFPMGYITSTYTRVDLSRPHPSKNTTRVRRRDRRHYAPFRLAWPYTTCDTAAMQGRYDRSDMTRASRCFSVSSDEDDTFVIRWMRTLKKMASKLITVLYKTLIPGDALPVLTTMSSTRF